MLEQRPGFNRLNRTPVKEQLGTGDATTAGNHGTATSRGMPITAKQEMLQPTAHHPGSTEIAWLNHHMGVSREQQ